MIFCTYIYAEIEGTRYMRESVARHGHELAVASLDNVNPDAINRELLALYNRAASGHKKFVYTDSADTFLQRPMTDDEIPADHILYSTEKNCYPYPDWRDRFPFTTSPFKFLNGGGVCGPLELMIEYHERYKLASVGGMNGQAYLQQQFFQALEDGFPIKLDTDCKIFQTIAFTDDRELEWRDGLLVNKISGSMPALLHGNGRTEMKHIYESARHNQAV